ncbi:MAG: hypothetical protein ACRDNG_04720 [Gaiellaceae bacterium]
MARERALKERRALKQQKKDERKQAAAAARSAEAGEGIPSEDAVDDEAPSRSAATADGPVLAPKTPHD